MPCEAARLFTFNGPSVFDDMKSLADPKAEWPAKVLRAMPKLIVSCLDHAKVRATVTSVVPELAALVPPGYSRRS